MKMLEVISVTLIRTLKIQWPHAHVVFGKIAPKAKDIIVKLAFSSVISAVFRIIERGIWECLAGWF
jgi:hypothetical protein